MIQMWYRVWAIQYQQHVWHPSTRRARRQPEPLSARHSWGSPNLIPGFFSSPRRLGIHTTIHIFVFQLLPVDADEEFSCSMMEIAASSSGGRVRRRGSRRPSSGARSWWWGGGGKGGWWWGRLEDISAAREDSWALSPSSSSNQWLLTMRLFNFHSALQSLRIATTVSMQLKVKVAHTTRTAYITHAKIILWQRRNNVTRRPCYME